MGSEGELQKLQDRVRELEEAVAKWHQYAYELENERDERALAAARLFDILLLLEQQNPEAVAAARRTVTERGN